MKDAPPHPKILGRICLVISVMGTVLYETHTHTQSDTNNTHAFS